MTVVYGELSEGCCALQVRNDGNWMKQVACSSCAQCKDSLWELQICALYWPLISTISPIHDSSFMHYTNKTCWIAEWVVEMKTP